MSLAMAALGIGVAGAVGAWAAARALAAVECRITTAGLSCVAFILLWFYAEELSDLGLRLITWEDYVFFERIPLYFAILLLLFTCHQRLERRVRLLVGIVIGLFGAYAVAEVGAPLPLGLYLNRLDDSSAGRPEVHQSTGWSCRAAALAWAMRLKGVPASERQMAELAVTAPLRGTKLRGMLRAAHKMGLDAEAHRRASWEDLVAAPSPALAGWKLSLTVGHVVVVIGIEGEQVTVGDPLLGEVTWSRDEFLDRWDRDLITIRRRQHLAARRTETHDMSPRASCRALGRGGHGTCGQQAPSNRQPVMQTPLTEVEGALCSVPASW